VFSDLKFIVIRLLLLYLFLPWNIILDHTIFKLELQSETCDKWVEHPVTLFPYHRWASSVSSWSYNGDIPFGCLVFWQRWHLRVPGNLHSERTLS